MINKGCEKLPMEYPLLEMLKIYAKRLGVLLAVVAVNLVILGFLFLISQFPNFFTGLSVFVGLSILLGLVFVIAVWVYVYFRIKKLRTRKQLSEKLK